jgi:hypothetical protein
MLPLMYYREKFGDYRITEFLIKLDNLFSVMWITGKRDVETRMFMMMRQMDELSKQTATSLDSIPKIVDDFLMDATLKYDFKHDKAKTEIDINEFFDLLDNEPWGEYAGTRINKFKYVLLKLDFICGNRNARIHYQRSVSSIEHILPRHIENTKWNISKSEHEIWCHRLGNLVLLDKRKNTSMSNDLYHDKKKKYSNSIGERAYTNKVFMDYNTWTIQNLMKNHQQSVLLLKQYYEGNSLETILNLHKR